MGRLAAQWQKLPVTLTELCIDTTLRCGQSFRWRKFGDEWRCTLHGRILSLRQDAESLYYKAAFPSEAAVAASSGVLRPAEGKDVHDDGDDTKALVRRYFHLQLDLRALYDQWSRDDANFRKKAPQFSGIRILNQDAWEALVCFICSSNNNIARISQMAHKLCVHYGPKLGQVDGEDYHDFPSPAALAQPSVEAHLRQLGFGYRAKYIVQTAAMMCETGPGWLRQLRNPACPPPWTTGAAAATAATATDGSADACVPTYKTAHEQLLTLSGVGPKVADCVCLMGLGWGEAVPVDTHVWQIAVRDYKFKKLASKTFSRAIHDAVGDHFRTLWGPYAGWAQSVLFTANLKSFSEQLKNGGDLENEDTAASESGKTSKKEILEDMEEKESVARSSRVTTAKRKRTTVVKVEEETKVAVVQDVQTRPKRRRRG
ncbi:hypothetical protein HMPREF1624_07636 [Sporothrix schenckii ATCC 58251]|uniref:DNA-(apurinic or apyrimidinic site) lyase n=1 Tax=Sporothrix schenckii (strain ATCC 58251 / de Perez 2211183) TaxID=1391915 RepID=U7PNN1_SPOS1|nr:hypothetical protein HMPREF1624_07636 [Sporothrix schenckii ATCC 58251]